MTDVKLITSVDIGDGLAIQNGKLTTEKEQDTGWYDITQNLNISARANPTGYVYLRRIGKMVHLAFRGFSLRVLNLTEQSFLPPEICKYTYPALMYNQTQALIRNGGWIPADNRNATAAIYDWLTPTNFRYVQVATHVSYATISWITDTPFPEKPVGEFTPIIFAKS